MFEQANTHETWSSTRILATIALGVVAVAAVSFLIYSAHLIK